MPFPFNYICDLLQELEDDWSSKCHRKDVAAIIRKWFNKHHQSLKRHQVDRCALLSTLLPERRTDRVYGIQAVRLKSIFARALGVGKSRLPDLARWLVSGSGVDLADCIADIIRSTPGKYPVREEWPTIEDIDAKLHALAAAKRFSSPIVRSSIPESEHLDAQDTLGDFYNGLSPRDAKWFTRLILKNYKPVLIPEWIVYTCCDELLPVVLKIHDSFTSALRLLDDHQRARGVLDGVLRKDDVMRLLKPQIGVKVGRQTWIPARSIKHCLSMGRGEMSCEKKYDGEYCQIHIDLAKGEDNCIQIFSKSGKDSTEDRVGLHRAILSSLGIGTSTCKFRQRCILEGEMVIYSNKDRRILGFEKIRKHVTRSGSRIGTAHDSQSHDYEHPMIVYFDLLLVDDDSLLIIRHSERLRRLAGIVQCQEGRAALVERQIVNFSSSQAAAELRDVFGSCITRHEEGLVIKPDEPYFDYSRDRRPYASTCLKLKKGYVKGLGDAGDFAVVGARYDATMAKEMNMPDIKFTHFYLGCLLNKEEIDSWEGEKPRFKVVNEVTLSPTHMKGFLKYAFPNPVKWNENKSIDLEVPFGICSTKRLPIVFANPPVFEMVGFQFHKDKNTRFWGLRFSYAQKIHFDRTWKDCVGYDELQELAETEMNCPVTEDSQEMARWVSALEEADPQPRGSKRRKAANSGANMNSLSSSRPKFQDIVDRDFTSSTLVKVAAESLTPPPSSTVNSPSSTERGLGSSSPRSGQKRPRETRPVLQDITQISASQNNVLSGVPEMSDKDGPSSSLEELLSLPFPQSSSLPSHTRRMGDTSTPKAHATSTPPSSAPALAASHPPSPFLIPASPCVYSGSNCRLAKLLVLLSPCIANNPLLTENLLPNHGVAAIYTDLDAWRASISTRVTSAPRSKPGSSTTPTRKPRQPDRLILVEHCREEATAAFIKMLEQEPLRDRNDKRIYALVYDWRLLESITAEESKPRGSTKPPKLDGTAALLGGLGSMYYVGIV